MPEIRTSEHELRVCDNCGRENARARDVEREAEVPCMGCKSIDFTIYDALWIERSAASVAPGISVTHMLRAAS